MPFNLILCVLDFPPHLLHHYIIITVSLFGCPDSQYKKERPSVKQKGQSKLDEINEAVKENARSRNI